MEIIRTQELEIPSSEYRQVSDELMNILKSLLQKDVSKRATLESILFSDVKQYFIQFRYYEI